MAEDKLMSSGVRELPIFQPRLGLPRGVSPLACGSQLSTLRGRGGPALFRMFQLKDFFSWSLSALQHDWVLFVMISKCPC